MIDLEEAELGEISGEFGDNISMSSRGRVVVTPEVNLPVAALPPDDEPAKGYCQRFKPVTLTHMRALIWKNFMGLVRNFRYVNSLGPV